MKEIDVERSRAYFQEMLQANRKSAEGLRDKYRKLASGQKPKVVIAYCSDSRLQTVMFGDDIIGNLFVGRDIGNAYEDSEAAVDYAIRHLGVPTLFIMGHTGCGAIAAALGDYSGETAAIQSRLDKLHTAPSEEGLQALSSQLNVDHQVDLAKDRYSERLENNQLNIVGGIFDLCGCYNKNHEGDVYITNINGIVDLLEIKQHQMFKGFDASFLDSLIKRL